MKAILIKNLLFQIVLVLVLTICFYFIWYPITIETLYSYSDQIPINHLTLQYSKTQPKSYTINCQSDNILTIPTARINGTIITSNDNNSLDMGFWHLATSGNPEIGKNMIITGHRFMYLPPLQNTFYNLDLVKPGNKIYVCWENVIHEYIVTQVFITYPDDTSIHSETYYPSLTIYTCTPKWSNKQRLVVKAQKLNY